MRALRVQKYRPIIIIEINLKHNNVAIMYRIILL